MAEEIKNGKREGIDCGLFNEIISEIERQRSGGTLTILKRQMGPDMQRQKCVEYIGLMIRRVETMPKGG